MFNCYIYSWNKEHILFLILLPSLDTPPTCKPVATHTHKNSTQLLLCSSIDLCDLERSHVSQTWFLINKCPQTGSKSLGHHLKVTESWREPNKQRDGLMFLATLSNALLDRPLTELKQFNKIKGWQDTAEDKHGALCVCVCVLVGGFLKMMSSLK